MSHQFSRIPSVNIQRSTFDRSHGYKTTFNAGYLIPFFCDEVLPGDTFNLDTTLFARLSTPIVPFMDNLFLETFFFYVPTRLVWDNFQKFMGEQINPGDSTDYLVPTIKLSGAPARVGGILDYFGIPPGVDNLEINALPFRAYAQIWNDWFRDENLQDSLEYSHGDTDTGVSIPILRRGKRHDYFTSCLPWPQKGESVDVPLSADIVADGPFYLESSSTKFSGFWGDDGAHWRSSIGNTQIGDGSNPLRYHGGLKINTSTNSPITINDLRTAFQVQKLLERDARGGTRYTEILRSHFGVVSPDARLQRSEFLGGGSARININPVQQTSASDSTSPQGNLAAYGVVASRNHSFTKSFVEHGYIIGLVNVRADLTYQQGLNRMWSRKTRYDFYWPVLAHLGEQAVLNKEIYAQGTDVDDDVFGYQERYAEYRYKPSLITGLLRSTAPQTLDVWHLSQKFESLPKLNDEFIVDNPPIERVLAVQNEPQFILDAYFNLKCTRPMPLYGVPGLVDHF